jgi:hypothetical protein
MKIASIVLGALGLLTLIPSPGASKACLLGYKAKCTFSPISTLILFGAAAIVFIVYQHQLNHIAGGTAAALMVGSLAVVLGGAGFFLFKYFA